MKKIVPNKTESLTNFLFLAKFAKDKYFKIFYLFIIVFLHSISATQAQLRTETLTGSGSWKVPCGVTSVTVEVWGGGGAGGGATTNNRGGGGGAGGAYARSIINVAPNTNISYQVGDGGTGGNGNGQAGGDSWFVNSSTIIAKGGAGGGVNNGAGGVGTLTGTIGDFRTRGGDGAAGNNANGRPGGGGAGSLSNGGDATNANPGAGGNAGGGDGGARQQDDGVGYSGQSIGGGGGGGRKDNFLGLSNRRGGHGADGRIVISYVGVTPNYCIPSFSTVEPITLVVFAGINNASSAASGSANTTRLPYEQFCATANVTAGLAYPIQVKGNTAGNFTNNVTVFIDWNQDGSFAGTNERYDIGTLYGSTGTDAISINNTINVPGTALPGLTAMRVYKYDPPGTSYIGNACDNSTYGQAEDYLVQVEASCQQPTSATANTSTIAAATSITICSGTQVTLRPVGGSLGVNQSWRWYSGACGGAGPALTGIAADGSVVVTPTATTTYYVRIEGGTCLTTGTCRSVVVNVNQPGTISHTSGTQNIASACKNAAITNVVYTVGGGSNNASVSWSPSAPAGINTAYNSGPKTFTVSGTPGVAVVPGIYTYTITTSGASSPCTNAQIIGSIIVTDRPSFSYTGGPYTFCRNAGITPLNPTVNTGGLTTTFSAPFGLPAGLGINSATGQISGTPTNNSGYISYTIRASNSCGNTDVVISARVISGNAIFNIIPSGNLAICSNSTGVSIGLNGSESDVNYQLYRDLSPVGAPVAGTGNAISFGTNFTTAGNYTIVGTTNCPTNMNGTFTLSVTPNPTSTITYPASTFCKTDDNPIPTISGTPNNGGTFIASSSNLVFANTTSGEIDLAASIPGTYNIHYRIAASGGCALYNSPAVSITIANGLNSYTVGGGGSFCAGIGGLPVTLNGSQSGITYQLWRDGAYTGSNLTGTGAGLTFPNQTTPGNYAVVAVSGGCLRAMDGIVSIVENPMPAAISVTPNASTICQGSVLALTATAGAPNTVSDSRTFSSGVITQNIPDNDPTGTFYEFKVTGVPAGATITGVALDFYITHGRTRDLTLNLKGPNGNVLNIANTIPSSNVANFGNGTGTGQTVIVNSSSGNPINTATHPYTAGPYAPHGAGNVAGITIIPEDTSNVATFGGLYGSTSASVNGNWYFTVRDKANGATAGILRFCRLVITYTVVNNPTAAVWTPPTDLYSDPGASVPYVAGTELSRVYVKPSTAGPSVVYTATAGNGLGCFRSATANLNVTASPNILMKANYCAVPGKVRIVAVSSVPIASGGWLWNTGSQGTVLHDSSYIDVDVAGTYYVSAKAASGSCNGTGVMSIAQELVTNGNFELGNTGFTTGYSYRAPSATLITQGPPNEVNPLWDEGTYGVGTDGKYYHNYFFGYDHTYGTGTGNFMLVNGVANDVVWEHEAPVTVIPNTNYYFSGWVLSLNDAGNDAELKFRVNNTDVGISAIPDLGTPLSSAANNKWKKFHGTWNSGSATTAVIQIVNLNNEYGGNDFGLDDISFGTLTTFFSIVTPPSTSTQTGICAGTAIADIIYEIGGDGNAPTISGSLPAGVTGYWNGRTYRISGTPTAAGNHTYTITSTGCAAQTRTVTINVVPASNAGTFASPIVSACYNTAGSLSVSGSVGTTYVWESSVDGSTGWAPVSGAPNSSTFPHPALTSERYYRVTARNTSACATHTSAPVKVGLKNVWTGKTNDSWGLTSNWSDEQVPTLTPCPSVIVPNVSVNGKPMPYLNGNTVEVGNLVIDAGAGITIANDALLQVRGTITSPVNSIDAETGKIELKGSTLQQINGNWFVRKNIKELIVSNDVAINPAQTDTLNILDKLSFGSVSGKQFNSNDKVTIKSTAAKTASVGEIKNGNSVVGKFNIERYLKSYRGWRFLAAPIKGGAGSPTITQAWREGGTGNPNPGYGTQITGPVLANGFDQITTTPSIKWYQSSSNNYINVANTNVAIARPEGYMVFVRGDRTVTASGTPSATNLRIKGELLTGTQTYNVGANAFISVGNPYASAISAEMLLAQSLQLANGYLAWDPSLNGPLTNGVGAYQNISPTNGWEPSAGGSSLYSASTQYKNIQSGQAVFLQNLSAANYQFYITESMKVNGSLSAMSREYNDIDRNYMRVKLYNATGDIVDGNAVAFDDEFSSAIDRDDAVKFANSGENFGILRNGVRLGIEARGRVQTTDTIFYNMTNIKVADYKLAIAPKNFNDPLLTAFMVDKFLNTTTAVSITDSSFISFSGTSAAASRAADRFMMVFRRSIATPLPVTIVSVAANRNTDRTVAVRWKVENEISMLKYEVERSANGANFQSILTTAPTAVNGGSAVYLQTDLSPLAADNFYRIKAISLDGQVQYSAIVKVAGKAAPALISVYPNPVENKQMNISFAGQLKGDYTIELIGTNGQIVYKERIVITNNNQMEQVQLASGLSTGRYQLRITANDAKAVTTIMVLIQ